MQSICGCSQKKEGCLLKLEKVNRILWIVAITILLMFPVFTRPAFAEDTNDEEVGVEWIEDYSAYNEAHDDSLEPLDKIDDNVEGFYDTLYSECGWTKRFNMYEGSAWESDFEKYSVGGYDHIWIDTVDFAYFSGHGYYDHFPFNVDADNNDYDWRVHYTEVSWGDKDLEWIVIASCLVLNAAPDGYPNVINRWGWPVFHGLHAILGFHSVAVDKLMDGPFAIYPSPGEMFVHTMIGDVTGDEEKIGESWELMTDEWQGQGHPYGDIWGACLGQVKRVRVAPREFHNYIGYNDYLRGYGYVMDDMDPPHAIAYHKWLCEPWT